MAGGLYASRTRPHRPRLVKIALVVPGGVDRSGDHRVIPVLLALIARLSRGHDVHVFALHQEKRPARWPLLGAEVHNIGEGWTRLRAVRAIVAEHRRGAFDIVQAIFSGSTGEVAVAASRWLRIPGMVHIAGGELVALPAIGYGGRLTFKGRLREAAVLRSASYVTAASTPIVASLHGLGIEAVRVPLGVDIEGWPPATPRARRSPQARLLHVASLNGVKDQPTLLRAMSMLVHGGLDVSLDIVGTDTLDGAIQAMARERGLEGNVRFLGFRTQRELRPLMEQADLLVMSSLHEAGPMVLLEAAVAGLPTVGTAVGHLAEWAPDAAWAVPVGDAAALAAAVTMALCDDGLRLSVAAAAQRRALAEDADYTARAFEALYRRLAR